MIISWNWLNEYVDLRDLDPVQASRRFTVTTAEIEDVILPPSHDFLSQFIVAEVKDVQPHPNADKLRCCKVYDGDSTLDIVCGASNVREGLKTILAPIGCDFGDFKIKKSKLRGEVSEGMLCSEKELGIGPGDEGIIELDSVDAGQKLSDINEDLGCQWDLDNKAITHRPDLWGHYGLGREAAAVFQKPFKELRVEELPTEGSDDGFEVSIKNKDLCRRYCGCSLANLTVQPSPLWMQKLLKEVGQTPINNIVDVTNFVMLELGQPTHAFDIRRLPSRSISVETARDGESFETLTGKSLELNQDDLVIRSGNEIVALAGVVGGENSSIQDDTTEVFLEAAHFSPLGIRRTAHRYDCRTDSSSRFEKSLDPENALLAMKRIVHLLRETCPDLVINSKVVESYPNPIDSRVIELHPEDVCLKMGVEISTEEQKEILERLGFTLSGESPMKVTVPSYRNTKDIEEPIDLIEEIGRIAGYDRIVPMSPHLSLEARPPRLSYLRTRRLQDRLVARGYSEVKTYSFASENELVEMDWDLNKVMKLANPMNSEQAYMRPNLLIRQLEVWKLNAKNSDAFSMFELGTVFEGVENQQLPDERMELMVSLYGESGQGENFYQLKSDILSVLESEGFENARVVKVDETPLYAHPARCGHIQVSGKVVGYIAELHPSRSKELGLKKRLTFAVMDSPLKIDSGDQQKYTGLDKFPAVPFSLSLIVDSRTTAGEVLDVIQAVDNEVIQDLRWVGNYEGAPIPEGKLSMTIAMNFRLQNRTMNGDEIQTLQDKIISGTRAKGFTLREG